MMKTQQFVPGLAPAAMQMGRFVAQVITDQVRAGGNAKQRPSFTYRDKDSLATIGIRRAVADICGLRFGGLPAWLTWCFVHLMFLIGFRSKIMVMISWIWAYLLRSRTARLITGNIHMKIKKFPVQESHKPAPTFERTAKNS